MIRVPLQSGATADFMSTTGHFFRMESDFKPVDPFTSWMAALLNSAVFHFSYAFNIPNGWRLAVNFYVLLMFVTYLIKFTINC